MLHVDSIMSTFYIKGSNDIAKTPHFFPLPTTLIMSLSNSFEETMPNAPATATPAAAISDVGAAPATFSTLISVIFGPTAAGAATAHPHSRRQFKFNLERIFVSQRDFSHNLN